MTIKYLLLFYIVFIVLTFALAIYLHFKGEVKDDE